jgi:hypothetical protein
MNPTLHFFGCSHGLYGTVDGSHPDAHTWTTDKSVPMVLSKLLNTELNNQSWAGSCNYQIFRQALKVMDSIGEDDIVFMQWTYVRKIWTTHGASLWISDSPIKNTPREVEIDWMNNMTVDLFDQMTNTYYHHFFDTEQELSQLISFNNMIKSRTKGKYYFSIIDSEELFKIITPEGKFLRDELLNDPALVLIDGKQTTTDFLIEHPECIYDNVHASEEGCKRIAEGYFTHITGKEYDF